MISIKDSTDTSFVLKKSRFLGFACRITSEEKAKSIVRQHKKQHYNASHNCFAYLLENGVMRYSDDGEPQSTAGRPMLEVIKKSGLVNVLIICSRYFGGTLLGAGGLVRAYTKSAADSLDAAKKIELIECSVFSCSFSYNTWSKAQKLLADEAYILDNIDYSSEICANISVLDDNEDAFIKLISSVSLGKTVPLPLGKRRIEREI